MGRYNNKLVLHTKEEFVVLRGTLALNYTNILRNGHILEAVENLDLH